MKKKLSVQPPPTHILKINLRYYIKNRINRISKCNSFSFFAMKPISIKQRYRLSFVSKVLSICLLRNEVVSYQINIKCSEVFVYHDFFFGKVQTSP